MKELLVLLSFTMVQAILLVTPILEPYISPRYLRTNMTSLHFHVTLPINHTTNLSASNATTIDGIANVDFFFVGVYGNIYTVTFNMDPAYLPPVSVNITILTCESIDSNSQIIPLPGYQCMCNPGYELTNSSCKIFFNLNSYFCRQFYNFSL
jgi:hypothetical protein